MPRNDENELFAANRYLIRKKALKLFGGAFHIYDQEDRLIGYCKQKAFKLKEDLRVYADEHGSQELLCIKARQVVDFSAAYDVTDSRTEDRLGTLRRRGLRSMLRDSWEILDADGRPLGEIQETGTFTALLRRFINLIPQSFHATVDGRLAGEYRQRFNPFVLKLEVDVLDRDLLDPRLAVAGGLLLAAIEGRQKN